MRQISPTQWESNDAAPFVNPNFHIFYYPWYGTPQIDGAWRHWQNVGHTPPDDIDSDYYPALGPYSSNDPVILDAHMKQMANTRIGVIVVSWWGQGSFEDLSIPLILKAAAEYNVKVAFHIEPYPGRTVASVLSDIAYIYSRYGNSAAFYRTSKPNKWGSSALPRGVFYIFDSLALNDADWLAGIDSIRGTVNDAILFGQTTDASRVDPAHWDGLYVYDAFTNDGHFYQGIGAVLATQNVLWSPTVGAGYKDIRNGGSGDKLRNKGNTYDSIFLQAITSHPTFISITSFNEWHEGSQIEAAVAKGAPYADYSNAYGKIGIDAQNAYMDRTRFWIQLGSVADNVPLSTPPYESNPSVASANDLVLPVTGNATVFHIAGTTQINTIDTTNFPAGAIIVLILEATITIKHNALGALLRKPIILSGAVDFVAANNNTLTLVNDDIGNAWFEIGRKT